jgi:hypothetical protein
LVVVARGVGVCAGFGVPAGFGTEGFWLGLVVGDGLVIDGAGLVVGGLVVEEFVFWARATLEKLTTTNEKAISDLSMIDSFRTFSDSNSVRAFFEIVRRVVR